LTKSLKVYIQTNIELIKLEATDRVSVLGADVVSGLIVAFPLLLFIFFLSFGVGLYLAACFENNYMGFLLVAVFYLFLTCLLILTRKRIIINPIRNAMIKRILRK